MQQMMQKLLLVQTDNSSQGCVRVDVQGQTQGDSQNMLIRNQNLKSFGHWPEN